MEQVCKMEASSKRKTVHSVIAQNGNAFKTACKLSLIVGGSYHETERDVTCRKCLNALEKSKLENQDPPVYVAIDADGTLFAGNTLEELRDALISTYGEEEAASCLELRENAPIKFFKAHKIVVEIDIQTVKYLKSIKEV